MQAMPTDLPSKWSLRRIVLWIFVVELLTPHLLNFYKWTVIGDQSFPCTQADFQAWIAELDPNASIVFRGGHDDGTGQSATEIEITADLATTVRTLSDFRKHIEQLAEDRGQWIHGSSKGGDSFYFEMSKGDTQFRIHCWNESAVRGFPEKTDSLPFEHVLVLKLIHYEFRSASRQLKSPKTGDIYSSERHSPTSATDPSTNPTATET